MNLYEYYDRLVSVYAYDEYLRDKFSESFLVKPVLLDKGSATKGYSMSIQFPGMTTEIVKDDFLVFYDKSGTIPDLPGNIKPYETLRVQSVTGTDVICNERISYDNTHLAYDDDFYNQVLPVVDVAKPTRTFLHTSYGDFKQEKARETNDPTKWSITIAPIIDNVGTVGVVSPTSRTDTYKTGQRGTPVILLETFAVVVRVPTPDNKHRVLLLQEVQEELLPRLAKVFVSMSDMGTEAMRINSPSFISWSLEHNIEGYFDIAFTFEVSTTFAPFESYPMSGNRLRAYKHADGNIIHAVSGELAP